MLGHAEQVHLSKNCRLHSVDVWERKYMDFYGFEISSSDHLQEGEQ